MRFSAQVKQLKSPTTRPSFPGRGEAATGSCCRRWKPFPCNKPPRYNLLMVVYKIHPVNPQRRHLETVATILKNENGIAVYPTDTVYGMGACITNHRALDRISAILHKDKTRLFSFVCCDFAQIANYAVMSNAHFRLMKRYLPGPYTFILPATNFVPKKISP